MTSTNKFRMYRQTKDFERLKAITNNLLSYLPESIADDCSQVELAVIKDLDFTDLERSSTVGPDEMVSYEYTRPNAGMRFRVVAHFTSDTGKDNFVQEYTETTGKLVLDQSDITCDFSIQDTQLETTRLK